MEYIRLCTKLEDKGKLVPKGELDRYINGEYCYYSLYYYTKEQYDKFKETGSVKNIKDVKTNRLVWDFDSEEDLNKAKNDTVSLINRLNQHGLKPEQFSIYFSGSKGFHVEILTDKWFSRKEIEAITFNLSEGLPTNDSSITDEPQIFRMPFTKHPKSGLYKICLDYDYLCKHSIEDIKYLAKLDTNGKDPASQIDLPDSIYNLRLIESNPEAVQSSSGEYVKGMLPDLSKKPRNLPTEKWILIQGFIAPGKKHDAMLALSAHYRGLGYPKEVTYRLLKGSIELRGRLFPSRPKTDNTELWHNVEEVYGPGWNGGIYYKSQALIDNAKYFGISDFDLDKEKTLVSIREVSDKFAKYAKNIDKNTVKTGIEVIDKQIRLQTCSHVVLAGCSGSGKTTLCLNILNSLSNSGLNGIFGSMDMNSNLIYQKLIQRVTKLDDSSLYKIYQLDNQERRNIDEKIDQEFKNIKFDFRSGIEVDKLREDLLEAKAKQGDNLKVVILDFINRIRGPYSDETANLSYIAPRLSDLANETETLIISLAQIARSKGGPSTPLTDSRVAKGSSAIEESSTVLFGIWRPGYNMGSDDRYMCMAALKTRMGKEFCEPLYFNGLTSEIRGLTRDEQREYEHFLDKLEEAKNKDKTEESGYGF